MDNNTDNTTLKFDKIFGVLDGTTKEILEQIKLEMSTYEIENINNSLDAIKKSIPNLLNKQPDDLSESDIKLFMFGLILGLKTK